MGTQRTTPAASIDAGDLAATVATLEQTNGELAEQLHDVQVSLAARDATIGQMTVAAERAAFDLTGLRSRVSELEAQATARETELSDARLRASDLLTDLQRMDERRSDAPLSLDIAALLDLGRIFPDGPYHELARRLGDRLVAQHAASADRR